MKREEARRTDSLSAKEVGLLERYVALLDQWRKITNLISVRSFAEVWTRHIEDSLRVHQAYPSAVRWLDIGSGAGFPAIVIAVLLSGIEGAMVHCVESDSRKCAFLRAVSTDLDIPIRVHNRRAETVSPQLIGVIDAVTARAFSSTEKILQISREFLALGAVAVLPRGKTWETEVVAAGTERYTVRATEYPDVILVIEQEVA